MFGKKKKLEEKQVEEQKSPVEQSAESELGQQDDGIDFFDSELLFDDEVEAEVLTDEEAAQLEELQAFLVGGESEDEEEPSEEEQAAEEQAAEEPVEEEQAPQEEPQPESEEEPEEAAEEEAPAEEEEAQEEPEEELHEDEESEEADEEAEEEEKSESEEESEESEEGGGDDEEVVYVVDGPEEDDEIVRPARLVKLPHLVDYMIAQGMSKQMKVKVALMLVQTYKKFKDSPEDNRICMQCLAKIMQELMKK